MDDLLEQAETQLKRVIRHLIEQLAQPDNTQSFTVEGSLERANKLRTAIEDLEALRRYRATKTRPR